MTIALANPRDFAQPQIAMLNEGEFNAGLVGSFPAVALIDARSKRLPIAVFNLGRERLTNLKLVKRIFRLLACCFLRNGRCLRG